MSINTDKAMAALYRSAAIVLLSGLIYFVKQDLNTAHENSQKLSNISVQTARIEERTEGIRKDIDDIQVKVNGNQSDIDEIFRKLGGRQGTYLEPTNK